MIRVPEPTIEHRKILVECAMVPEGRHLIEIRVNGRGRSYVVSSCDPRTTSAAKRLGATTCLLACADFHAGCEVVRCATCDALVIRVSITCPFENITSPPTWPPRHHLEGVALGPRA